MRRRIDLFCEDAGHESFGRALVERCAAQEGVRITVNVPTARFGIPRLKNELRAFQSVLRHSGGTPDLLLVLVDANLVGVPTRRREVEAALEPALFPVVVIGVPDPCVERWLIADPQSFAALFGIEPNTTATMSGQEWKDRLVTALEASGEIVTQGGAEFADEIVEAMDLYRGGRLVPSLKSFADDLTRALRQLKAAEADF